MTDPAPSNVIPMSQAPTVPVGLLVELIRKRERIAAYIKQAIAQEVNLRLKIIKLAWPETKIGTNNFALVSQGLNLKAVIKETASCEEAGLQDLVDEIPNNAGLLKFKPEISVSKYRALSDEHKALLAKHVTIKAAMPSLEAEGELPQIGHLDGVTAWNGMLYKEGIALNFDEATALANLLGLASAQELVSIVAEIG